MTTEKLNIPILDLSPEIDMLWDELQDAIKGVLRSGHFIMGPNVKAFEEEVAAYLGVKHAIGLNSGTDALFLALRALGVGSGDEVITTAFTFFATAEAISHVGAKPVFVDIDPQTYNMDAKLLEAAITPRTRAIIPVHLFGHACDMDAVSGIAARHGIYVVEDVAQAFGGQYKGRRLGSIGDVAALSFFPTKNLGAYGDAGLLATNDDELAATARMLRAHGSKQKYFNEVVGYNSRLDELQAAILRVKLPHLDDWNARRREVAVQYGLILSGMAELGLPSEASYAYHVYHQFTVCVRDGKRDVVKRRLREAGIDTMVYYPRALHQLPVYSGMETSLPNAEFAAASVLSLPIWPLLSVDHQERVGEALRGAFR